MTTTPQTAKTLQEKIHYQFTLYGMHKQQNGIPEQSLDSTRRDQSLSENSDTYFEYA